MLEEVARLFAPVIKKNGKYGSVRVRSTMVQPSLNSHELLVYLVPNYDYSVIKDRFGVAGGDVKEVAGRTVYDRGAAEVYIAGETVGGGGGVPLRIDWLIKDPPELYFSFRYEPKVIAQVIFHEALHNKARMDESESHGQKGPQTALFREAQTHSSKQSAEDIALMAKYLDKKVVQWTGGWTQLGPS